MSSGVGVLQQDSWEATHSSEGPSTTPRPDVWGVWKTKGSKGGMFQGAQGQGRKVRGVFRGGCRCQSRGHHGREWGARGDGDKAGDVQSQIQRDP